MPNHAELYYNTGVVTLMAPAVHTADANSAVFDLQDCDDALIAFILGAAGDTLSANVNIACEVQESDDGSTFTPVANLDLTNFDANGVNSGTVKLVNDNSLAAATYFAGYRGVKRYIRGVLNITGTQSSGTIGCVMGFRGRNRQAPVNN